ncbi:MULTISPECIES: hypothetical protein [Mycolicibacterium]|uniref:Uncharacterized protein n=1 Tax=Mycolicibacterium chubuense (strain NBB4) TaxID=710421 RepID=I4BT74_MYCCN|nr:MULTISPECIES: hypothetical protein [Mycolicibacterium]AFM20481.1 hypothetical protein Mycch_5867 [Mycolicibacterium chubuense NBB4]MBU8841588.1 hypothetical protein [Mycolicibacterium goodii]
MSDSADETTIGEREPTAHHAAVLQQLRKDPHGIERVAVAIGREVERRQALFGGGPRVTSER